ncbi:MAG: hypothetical protein NTW03_03065, partial [Verrucomicrobia bacterium]|nr:hypothetical protein [Verrucomicrobiota bacterium]
MNNLLKMILIASFSVNVTELPAVGDTKAPAQEAQQKWAALLTKHLEDAKEAARRAINERSKAEILRCIGRIETSLGNVTEAKKT